MFRLRAPQTGSLAILLAQRERRTQEAAPASSPITRFGSRESPSGTGKNLFVVEGQRRWCAQPVPAHFCCVIRGTRLDPFHVNHREECHAHRPAAGITAGVTECCQLFQPGLSDTRLLEQLAPSGGFQGLVLIDKAAGNSPLAQERFVLASDKQNPRRGFARDDHHIHRDGRAWVFVTMLFRAGPSHRLLVIKPRSGGFFRPLYNERNRPATEHARLTMFDILITGGRVVDGSGLPWFTADVGIRGDRIAAIGKLAGAEARTRLDATGKVVAPGFIDAHVHGDLMLLADPLHEPAIRQGVTTYILGQDGVAMAPASPATLDHMRRYTAGFSGGTLPETADVLPRGRFLSVAEYLALFDQRTALNVATLVPNGNVRLEVMGLATRLAHPDEIEKMARLVREGMEQGAVGLSSGLDYIPSRYASTEELALLCREIAPFGGVYVTHMRSYVPESVLASMDEVYQIGREAGVGVHISHFNSKADLVLPKIDAGRAAGVDVTYDLYCYLAGCTILGMIALPPEAQEGGVDATLARLQDPGLRASLHEGFGGPRGPLDKVRLSWIASEKYRHLEGLTLAEAAGQAGLPLGDFICEVLQASRGSVCCIAPHQNRSEADVRALLGHPAMMAGSDGIFTGGNPHPRGWGCFARYLGYYARDQRAWSLEHAVRQLSYHAARRYQLTDRGLLRNGMAADVVVFDPDTVVDRATFAAGRELAVGMEQVLVNGELVLHEGQRTPALPGRGLHRGT